MMKTIIAVLVVVLLSVNLTLHISKTEATSIHIHSITFEDDQGNVLQSDLFASGADLSQYNLPVVPIKDGYTFVGWSYDVSMGMPDANIIILPQYIQTEYSITNEF